jgi:hypothetical protein
MIERQGDWLGTAPEIAEQLGIEPERVRQWGARGKVRRHQGDGVTWYSLTECAVLKGLMDASTRGRRAAT